MTGRRCTGARCHVEGCGRRAEAVLDDGVVARLACASDAIRLAPGLIEAGGRVLVLDPDGGRHRELVIRPRGA